MGSVFASWLASLVLWGGFLSAAEEWSGSLHATLYGKLVRKHFEAPSVVQNPPFGWFLELDSTSEKITSGLFQQLEENFNKISHSGQ